MGWRLVANDSTIQLGAVLSGAAGGASCRGGSTRVRLMPRFRCAVVCRAAHLSVTYNFNAHYRSDKRPNSRTWSTWSAVCSRVPRAANSRVLLTHWSLHAQRFADLKFLNFPISARAMCAFSVVSFARACVWCVARSKRDTVSPHARQRAFESRTRTEQARNALGDCSCLCSATSHHVGVNLQTKATQASYVL
jgi:hypothetical protein